MFKAITLVFVGIFVAPFVTKWYLDIVEITNVLNSVISGLS